MHSNRLAGEKSPYLLQHGYNPVDWYPWGSEAFEKARREDKPIFLSIGYSTCHWCHVMERESFENEQIAEVMNRNFVNIKVDREERPDIDRIYMTFVQASTGSGGWPMSVWLTPELKPFLGGTYFPPENRYGRAGFPLLCERIAQAWANDRAQILESAQQAVRQLEEQAQVRPAGNLTLDPSALDRAFQSFRRTFDSKRGGFGEAPKFPRPSVFNFLLREYHRTGNQEALQMTLLTLREMAKGGMNDQIGGGFHRYSVDGNWFVPHFEKMLYDQAQLAISYLEAFQITGDPELAESARKTLRYVLRDMRDAAHGFYSAEDADSVIDPAHPEEKGEGAFYIWTQAEVESLLGQPAAEWFCYRFGVEPNGNVQEDPHGEFTGRNILFQAHTVAETAQHYGRDAMEMQSALLQSELTLFEARNSRVRPHLDDKVLTSWNGLMISAFAKAGAILNDRTYADAARQAADFILTRMYQPETGTLLRRYRQQDAAIPGFLDDYAFFAQALLDLYEAQFRFADLETAIALTDRMRERFEDPEHGAFFSSSAGEADLVMRVKEDYDGAEPSGNSIAVMNLLRLAQMTGREDFRQSAERALAAFAPRLMAAPMGVPQMLTAYLFSIGKPRQIVLAEGNDASGLQALLREVHSRYLPQRILLALDENSRARFAEMLPSTAEMRAVDERATAYVCENYACQLPVHEPAQLGPLLQ
jgi:hypothetical protein